jgi:hypothetical protein
MWKIIVPGILSLILLVMFIYFIFFEYFNDEQLSTDVCMQSISLRASSPEARRLGFTFVSFKETFPLKCKNQVVEITKEDFDNGVASQIILETFAGCWNLYYGGQKPLFPAASHGVQSYCAPCARIHFDEGAREYGQQIILQDELKNYQLNGEVYKDFLRDAFSFNVEGIQVPFSFSGDSSFKVDKTQSSKWDYLAVFNPLIALTNPKVIREVGGVLLPSIVDPSEGDILISFGQITSADPENFIGESSYLIYFNLENGNPFSEVKEPFVEKLFNDVSLCQNWDGVPA